MDRMTNVFIGFIIVVNVLVIYTPPQDENRSTAIILVTIHSPARINLFLPVSLHHPSRIYIDFFCSEQAKGLEVTCQGRYDDNLSVRHITGNHVVHPG